MSTTALFAEILVVGLEASAWISLAVLAVTGTGWLDRLTGLQDWAVLLTLIVVAAAYAIGVLIDGVADRAVEFTRKGMGKTHGEGRSGRQRDSEAWMAARMTVMNQGGDALVAFLAYHRSRLRVVRGTAINMTLFCPALAAFLVRGDWLAPAAVVGVIAGAVALALITWKGTWLMDENHDEQLKVALSVVSRRDAQFESDQ
jgi:hypothetical protein